MARQNTRLESEGAEFLVLGQLLVAGIMASKAYSYTPAYDILVSNPEMNTSARVSVKSRWKSNPEGFIIKKFDCDFVVIVKLNRGSKDGKAKVGSPEFFVLPIQALKDVPKSSWSKISFGHMPDLHKYKDQWPLIRDFLCKAKAVL